MENLQRERAKKNPYILEIRCRTVSLLYFSAFVQKFSYSGKMTGLYHLPLLFWFSKSRLYFFFCFPDCGVRNSRSLKHPFSAHTAAAATNPNWTWAIGTGSVDARCILKWECSHRTPSQGCHFVMHYAYMQMPDKEMDYLKGHLWFPAQRYRQQGKWSERSYHLVGAQLYGGVEKHSFRYFSNSKTGDDW